MSSTPKEIIFEEEARSKLLAGIKKLSNAVAFTLGPKGRNVGLEKSWGSPDITNDGNSVVKDIELEDQYENMGVSMGKEVAQKIKEKCGDGTTTGTILLNALVENGIRMIASGISPIGIKRGMDKAVAAIIKKIESETISIKENTEIKNIATVSASGNEEIGSLIAEAIAKVGTSGVVTIEEGKSTETTIELTEGMQFDRGYLSTYFCTDADKMIAQIHNPQILLVDKKISNIHELLPLLQTTASSGQELFIIAEDVEGDTLSTLVVNKLRGSLKVAAVKAPGFGDRRKALLEDIAALTGATVISEEKGMSIKDVTNDALGSAETITLTKDSTTIVKGSGSKTNIKARIQLIEKELESATSEYDKEKLQERKAKLTGGVAVIRVGSATEPEMKQKKQIFEDSLNSTKAALEEGVVAGGGVALLKASQVVESLSLEKEEAVGAQIVANACQAPLRQIVANSGFDSSVILAQVQKSAKNHGFNAMSEKVEDLIVAGVIDPTKVIKITLQNAASVAGIVLISEALIGNAPEEESKD